MAGIKKTFDTRSAQVLPANEQSRSFSRTPLPYQSWMYGALDFALVALVAIFGFGILSYIEIGSAPFEIEVAINTELSALPGYALLSLIRSLIALSISYVVAVTYGTLAARSHASERVLIPVLDVLQSLPVLTFLPGLVLGLTQLFSGSRWGLELACILMIFTGQVWNLAFAYYDSQRSIISEMKEVTRIFHLSPIRRFLVLDLPNGMRPLIYNGMMSMAGGWFFLTLCESFVLGDRNYRLPGLGSYLQATYLSGNLSGFCWGLVTLALLVVGVDFLLWKPLVAWVSRYRLDAGHSAEDSKAASTIGEMLPGSFVHRWISELYRRWGRSVFERLLYWIENFSFHRDANGVLDEGSKAQKEKRSASEPESWANTLILNPLGEFVRRGTQVVLVDRRGAPRLNFQTWTQWLLSFAAGGLVFYLLPRLPELGNALARIQSKDWLELTQALLMTALKVLGVLVFASIWTIPVGIWIAKRPRWARFLQPVIQNIAAFPAPVLFPVITFVMYQYGFSAGLIATLLMTFGNQWYLLFNVLSGAGRISNELIEVATVYRLSRWQRFRLLYFPSIFPSLVTGWITAAGGAWNASIVAELVHHPGGRLRAPGIGAEITEATAHGNYPRLVAAVIVITIALVVINRSVWRTMHQISERLK